MKIFRLESVPSADNDWAYNPKDAVVTSAIELDGKNKSKIEEYVSSIIKSAYELKFDIDSNLIGGFLLRIEDKVYDRSIKGRLNSIKNEIIK